MDAPSDVLGAVHLTGAVFLETELREQWSYLAARSPLTDIRTLPQKQEPW